MVWYYKDYPPIEIGKHTLNRNPDNYFAEVEQAAVNPANFVTGIGPLPDRMLHKEDNDFVQAGASIAS